MPSVLALVGTDHHQFDRLINWMDEAAVRNPEVTFIVQHGNSAAPLVARGHDFLPYDEILRLVEEVDAVVCHGGPGTIMDARGAGHVPICVPRNPELGEHVDGHQQRFARVMNEEGMVTTCWTDTEFQVALAERLMLGRVRGQRPDGDTTLMARQRITGSLDQLVAESTARRERRKVRSLVGRLFRRS